MCIRDSLSTDQSNRSPGFLNFQLTNTTTWLWRRLPHRLSKRQSITTVLLRTPITQMIFFNQGKNLIIWHLHLALTLPLLIPGYFFRNSKIPWGRLRYSQEVRIGKTLPPVLDTVGARKLRAVLKTGGNSFSQYGPNEAWFLRWFRSFPAKRRQANN